MCYVGTFLPGTATPVYVRTDDPDVRVYSYTRDLCAATPLPKSQADGFLDALRDCGYQGFILS